LGNYSFRTTVDTLLLFIRGAKVLENTATLSIDETLKSIQTLIQTAKFNDAISQSKQLLKQSLIKEQPQLCQLWYLLAVAQRYGKSISDALTSINEY
jgi:hypothetical protein